MQKLLLAFTLSVLMTLAACSGPASTPTPTPDTAPTPLPVTPTALPPTSTPEPTATTPPTATPTTSLTSGAATPGVLTPLNIQDPQALTSGLSEVELECIGGDPGRLALALTAGGTSSMAEQAEIIACLDDGTVDRLFLAGFVPVAGPLSPESSRCIRSAFRVINPRSVLLAGLEGDPETAMSGSVAAFTVALACLTDEEWTAAAPRLGLGPGDRDGMVCIMAALGGPSEMATAITGAMDAEQVEEGTALFDAGLECGMEQAQEPAPTP